MRIVEGVSVGISAMRSNKMRALLTILGIIIGVASVLAMIAIGDGAKEIVIQDAQKIGGANQLVLYRSWYKRVNNRWVRNRSAEYLKYEDVLAIEAECPSVDAVTPRVWKGEACASKLQAALKLEQVGTAWMLPIKPQWTGR